jgi:L-fuconolactonase
MEMPPFPIIDSHVHLWEPQRLRMPWIDGNAVLERPFLPADYAEHTAGVEIEAMVYLEVDVAPHYALYEPRWVLEQAQDEPRIKGIVAHAPVEYGERCRAYLEALLETGPLLKGVRRLIQGEGEAGFCTRTNFVRGVQLLGEYGLSFDICILHHQLADAIQLVQQCPDTQFVLDHIAKPAIRTGLLDPWREQMTALAALPNVHCKISGVATEADHANWTTDDVAPYILHALDAFGPDRVMFGGDWPVVLLASPYAHWVATLDALTEGLSDAAKRKLWADNARRFYRL